jgi:hypothetical protein
MTTNASATIAAPPGTADADDRPPTLAAPVLVVQTSSPSPTPTWFIPLPT